MLCCPCSSKKGETNAFYGTLLHQPYIIANQAAFSPFIEYFETQWVGIFQGARHIRKGSDSITWNCFKQVKDGLIKTTSSLEGWHSKFATKVRVKKPKFDKILIHLVATSSITPSQGINAPSKSPSGSPSGSLPSQ
ncbi:hypothetical protein DSO57_1021570 [Entomophthora muscae]|uniref:Uncharacterized protein n=1 Tax=Entomophthora muscae TaxID=34485 RepID=A0ACC2U194_9FUNG|nr:hypothetical protein DSO57_1021570 [Entomophthora muscae]